jgi:hypothetical protein
MKNPVTGFQFMSVGTQFQLLSVFSVPIVNPVALVYKYILAQLASCSSVGTHATKKLKHHANQYVDMVEPRSHFTARIKVITLEQQVAGVPSRRYTGNIRFDDGTEYRFESNVEHLEEDQEYVVSGGFTESPWNGEVMVEITEIVDQYNNQIRHG